MMKETLGLKLSSRSVTGKKVKRLRRDGLVPVHFYGEGTKSLALQVEVGVLRRLLPRAGANIPVSVEVDGQEGENVCFVREIQRHPVTDDLLHVDFLRVDVSQAITAEVPLVLEGDSDAVRELGGTLMQPFQTLLVEALPLNMPEAIHVDISGLDDFEKQLRISDIDVPEGATILREPDEMIARVLPPRIEEEEAEVAEEELAEGEEPAEGEEGAEAAEETEESQRSPSRQSSRSGERT